MSKLLRSYLSKCNEVVSSIYIKILHNNYTRLMNLHVKRTEPNYRSGDVPQLSSSLMIVLLIYFVSDHQSQDCWIIHSPTKEATHKIADHPLESSLDKTLRIPACFNIAFQIGPTDERFGE